MIRPGYYYAYGARQCGTAQFLVWHGSMLRPRKGALYRINVRLKARAA